MRRVIALLSGAVFGWGLALSGMTNPAKVLAFLDVAGNWDPSLAFVMGGALLLTTPAFLGLLRRGRPMLDRQFFLPSRRDLDAKLLLGSAIFGSGWGIAGLCPGPAIANLSAGVPQVALFVAMMVLGMWLSDLWMLRRIEAYPDSQPLAESSAQTSSEPSVGTLPS